MSEGKPHIDVCLTPYLLPLYDVSGKIVVVIDIFRATSTICTALGNGAKEVITVSDIEACLAYQDAGPEFILAAERGGDRVEGFSHGNSPQEYTRESVKGKTIVLTTTNGTRAIEISQGAFAVVAGSFLNISALCRWLKTTGKDVILLCAG